MTDTEEFLQLLRLENGNLEAVREEEPFLDDAIVYLSLALAHDCMAWEDPERYVEPNVELIESVARFGCLLKDQWAPEGILVYGGKIEIDDALMRTYDDRAKILRDQLLSMHLQKYGEGNEIQAYKETNTCLTYMIAAGCARSTDLDGSVDFVSRVFRYAVGYLMRKAR